MEQMSDKTPDQMNNWRWDNPHAFGEHVDRSNPQTTSLGKLKCTSEHFSWYGSDDLRVMIEQRSSQQYTPGDFLPVRPLIWDVAINEEDDDENWADPRAPSGGRSLPGDGNHNGDSEGEEVMYGGEIGTEIGKGTKDWSGSGKATEDGKGKGKGKGKGNGKGKDIVE